MQNYRCFEENTDFWYFFWPVQEVSTIKSQKKQTYAYRKDLKEKLLGTTVLQLPKIKLVPVKYMSY